jgi:hypothetical protein
MLPPLDLAPDDQTHLTAALEQLLADGFVWLGHSPDRRAYHDLARWRDLAAAQLRAKGWELIQHDSLPAFQVLHKRGKHRLHFKREAALCLLLLRLLEAETPAPLTPHPVVTLAAIESRRADFGLSFNLAEALPELAAHKLIRAAGGQTLRPTDPDQLLELLPTLRLVVPDSAIQTLGNG